MTDCKKLEQLSLNYKEQARNLLQESNLLEILKNYGTPILHGAFRYNLMLKPDIDIHLVTKVDGLNAYRELATVLSRIPGFSVRIEDFYTRTISGFPKGYILCVSVHHNRRKWNIDIYMMSKDENAKQKASYLIKYFGKCNEKERLEILRCKDWYQNNKKKYQTDELYDLFIGKDVTTFEEFKELIGSNEKI